jgi:hypothetical protein
VSVPSFRRDLLDALEDEDVAVDAHTDGRDDAGDAREWWK